MGVGKNKILENFLLKNRNGKNQGVEYIYQLIKHIEKGG